MTIETEDFHPFEATLIFGRPAVTYALVPVVDDYAPCNLRTKRCKSLQPSTAIYSHQSTVGFGLCLFGATKFALQKNIPYAFRSALARRADLR